MCTRPVRRVGPRESRVVGGALCLVLALMGGSALAHVEESPEATSPGPEQIQHANPSSSSPSKSKEASLQVASWFLTLPYGAAKVVYAIGGGIVGSLSWAMTGGKMEVAKSVWIPSMTGDYIVQPQHLTKEKPLRFLGVPAAEPSF